MRRAGPLFILSFAIGCSEGSAPAAPVNHRVPPPRPTVTVVGERRWFALSRVFLGVTRRDTGVADGNAWMDYGFDLDGRVTSKEDSRVSRFSCKRRVDTATNILADGPDGVDNNFGNFVVGTLKTVGVDPERSANASIAAGEFTLLLRIDGAVDEDNANAPGALYAAGPFAEGGWPVWSTALVDGVDLEKPLRRFPLGYVAQGTWVSGPTDEPAAPLWIPLYAGPVDMNATAVIMLGFGNGHGVIAGAIPAGELTRGSEGLLAKAGQCRGDAVHRAVESILQNCSDLVVGAPNLQDETKSCDSVSFGIGFDAKPTSAPARIVPGPPPAAPLPDCPTP